MVGKGVVFDIGGFNFKIGNYMCLMKKDMGGVVYVIVLVELVMGVNLFVYLKLYILVVENVIVGDVFCFGDVLFSCKGLSVEIDNIDVEGCLILGDVLICVSEEDLDLLIDFVILIGVVWVVFGFELVLYYIDDEILVVEIVFGVVVSGDLVWCMLFWVLYKLMLKSLIVDLVNSVLGGMVGLIMVVIFFK